MFNIIKLSSIKNKINNFDIKTCLFISYDNKKDFVKESFYPQQIKSKRQYYILCSNKRYGHYSYYKYNNFFNNTNGIYTNQLKDSFKDLVNEVSVNSINLEQFLILQRNKEYLGWVNSSIVNDPIKNLVISNCKYNKDKFYYEDNIYSVDESKLCLFIRIKPENEIDLTSLLVSCNRDNIYNISDRSNWNKVTSLGFIVEVRNRHEYFYSKTYNKVTKIKYPFINRNRINELLFDNFKGNYKIEKSLLYIKDLTELDKHRLGLVSDF